jgi:hypothetical protein
MLTLKLYQSWYRSCKKCQHLTSMDSLYLNSISLPSSSYENLFYFCGGYLKTIKFCQFDVLIVMNIWWSGNIITMLVEYLVFQIWFPDWFVGDRMLYIILKSCYDILILNVHAPTDGKWLLLWQSTACGHSVIQFPKYNMKHFRKFQCKGMKRGYF